MQPPIQSNSTQFEAQYTSKGEEKVWKSLTVNVANSVLDKNVTPEKIQSVVPQLLSNIGKPERKGGNFTQEITIIDYDPNRHLFRFEYNNKEYVFSEYAVATITLSQLKLRQVGGKLEPKDVDYTDLGFLSGAEISLKALFPELSGKKLTPQEHLKAISQLLRVYSAALLEQTMLKENALQKESLTTLAERSNQTFKNGEKLSEVLANDEKLNQFLNEQIKKLSAGPITLPFGYHREGGQFIPLFVNLTRKGETIIIQTVVIDPALKRKVIPFQTYIMPINETSDQRLFNLLRNLAQFTKQIPETTEKKGASALDVMNAAMQIAAGGAGQLQKINDKLKAIDVIEEMIRTKQTDDAKLKKAYEMLYPIDFTGFNPKTANQASIDFLAEEKRKLNKEKTGLETPKMEWTTDSRDVFTIIESLVTMSGATKQPAQTALVAASHDRFKIISNWLRATSSEPEQFKYIMVDIEANITTRLINYHLDRLNHSTSLTDKLQIIEQLEKLVDRNIKHRKKELHDEKRLLSEIEHLFGPFRKTISEIKKTLVQQSFHILDAALEEPHWSYKIQVAKESLATAKTKTADSPLIGLEQARMTIANAVNSRNITELSQALTLYKEKCKLLFDDFNYPELIKAVHGALELLPIPSSGNVWGNEAKLAEADAISEAITKLTQFAWEANLKTGRNGCYPNEVVNLLNSKAILTRLIQKQALPLTLKTQLSKEEKVLAVYANYTCDTEQAIHLLTKQAYLRYARNPELELRAMALLRFYQNERESGLRQITLDSYRQMVADVNEQRFLDEITSANGLTFPDSEKYKFYNQAWSTNWSRDEKNTYLPKLGIDLRRNALFIQTMLHPDWVMVKGFESDLTHGISKGLWLGEKLTEAAAETGETDPETLLKIVSHKELALLKEKIFSMKHLKLVLGQDSEKGYENSPAINFTDDSKEYQVGYHPRGFIAAELRNPYHDAPLIGQAGKIPEQMIATRTTLADSVDDAKSKRKREMDGLQPLTELTVLQEEQYNPSTSLSEIQNSQLRTLVVQSPNSALVSPLTFINVFNYIWKNPDQLENESIQRILEEALLSPGLIQSMLSIHMNLLITNEIKKNLKNAIEYACKNGRVKSALFLMHLGSLIKNHAASSLANQMGAMLYSSIDSSFKNQSNNTYALIDEFQRDLSSFSTHNSVKNQRQTGLEFFDRQVNSGQLDSGMKKFCYTYILDFIRNEHKPPYSEDEFTRILQGYAVIKNIWGDNGDPVIQREILDWVEKTVIPQFKRLDKNIKDLILSSIARGRSTTIPAEETVSWSEKGSDFISAKGIIVNIERGFVRQRNEPEPSFSSDLPEDILLNPIYKSLFGSHSQAAKRILKDNPQFVTYEFEKEGAKFVLSYHPLKRELSIYQNIEQDGKTQTFKLHMLNKEGKQAANFLERFGVWQNIHQPSEGMVILSSSFKPTLENRLRLVIMGKEPKWEITDCRTMDGRKVLHDPGEHIQKLFPFADPSDLIIVLQDAIQVEKGLFIDKKITINQINEIRLISKEITLKKDSEKGWLGTGDYNSYQLSTDAERIKEVQLVLGENSHQFALPFEKIIVTTTRAGKEQPQIVRKRQNLALIMPVQLQNEGSLKALAHTNTDSSIKPLQAFYETEEAIVEGKAIISRSRLKSTTTGFAYLSYAAFVEGDYDKAAKYLADAMDNPFAAHETKTLEKIVSFIRQHKDESIRGTAFKLKVEIAVRKIERDRKGLKEFRPNSWEDYLKKVHQDIALYQHYQSRMEDQLKRGVKTAVLGPLLLLTPEETQEYEQLIKESLQILLHNLKDKPIWETSATLWQSRVIPADVFKAFSHELAHHMQPPSHTTRIENQLATTTASHFLANFWSYADQIKREHILETDWRMSLLKNVVLTGIAEKDRKHVEVARQLLISFSKINTLIENKRKNNGAISPQEEELIESYQKIPQSPPKEFFNKILSSESIANAEALKKDLMKAAGYMIWRSILEALGLADPLRLPMQIYNQLDAFMLPLGNLHNTLNQPDAAQAPAAPSPKKSEQFDTSVEKLQSVLNDKQQSTFSVEELNFWKKAVEAVGKGQQETINLMDALRGAVAGNQLNLAAKRHETEVLRTIRALDKPKANGVKQPKKDPPLGRVTGDPLFIDTIQKYRNLINDYFQSESWEPGIADSFREIHSLFSLKPTEESTLFSDLYEMIRQSEKPDFLNNIMLQARTGALKTLSKKTLPLTLSWQLAQAAKIRLHELDKQIPQTRLPAFKKIDPKKPVSDNNQQAIIDELRSSEMNKTEFNQRYASIRNANQHKELNEIATNLSSSPFNEALLMAIALRKKEINDKVLISQLPQNPTLSSTLHSIYKMAEAHDPLRLLLDQGKELINLHASRLLDSTASKQEFNLIYRQIKNSRSEAEVAKILNTPQSTRYTSLLIPVSSMRILELRSQQPVSNLPELGESNQELQAVLHNSKLKNDFSDKYEAILLAQNADQIVDVISKEQTPYNKYLIQLGALRLKELKNSVNASRLPHVVELTHASFTKDLETSINKLTSKESFNPINTAFKKTFLEQLQKNNVPILTLGEVFSDPNNRKEFLNLYDQILKSRTPQELQKGIYDMPALRIAHLLSGAIAIRNAEISEGKSASELPDYRDFTISYAVRNLNDKLSSYSAEELAEEFQIINNKIPSRIDFNPEELDRNLGLIRAELSPLQQTALEGIQNEIVFIEPQQWAQLTDAIEYLTQFKNIKEVQDFLGDTRNQKINSYLVPFCSIRLQELSSGITSSCIPSRKDFDRLLGISTSSAEKIEAFKKLLANVQEIFVQTKQIIDIQSSLKLMLPNQLYFKSLGLLYQKVREAEKLEDLNHIPEALLVPELGGLLIAIRSKELEQGQSKSRLVAIREHVEIHDALEEILNPFSLDERKAIGKEAAKKTNALRFKIETLANPSEITQLYNQIIKTNTISDLETLIYYSQANIFQSSDLLLPVAAIRYKELHEKQAKSNLKEAAAFDPQTLKGIKIDNEVLAQIATRSQAFGLFSMLNEDTKRATIDTRCSEIRLKGEAIIQSMLTKASSPMEKAENELLTTAIRDEIKTKQNDIRNDRGVLPKNSARLANLRNILSGQVQFLIKDTKQTDILEKMKEYPQQFPGLTNMINRPDVFSDEEIFEKALDLYKSHQLINKFPNDPKIEHTLYLVEVWLAKYLYNVTELIQLNKALETLTQMEPLVNVNPQTLPEQAAWDVEWEEKSKTLLGFLQGAGNKERYLDKKTLVELENPAFSRRHLVAEYRNEMIARPAQPITVEKMVADNNCLILLRPGAGKSKWITPEVAQLLAQEKNKMPIILVTEELVHINRQDLDRDTRKMFNQAGHIFDFNRNTPKDVAYLADEYKRILDVKSSGGYIVTTIGKLAALDDEIASTLNDLSAANQKFRAAYSDLREIKNYVRDEAFIQQLRALTDIKKQLHGLQKLHAVLRQDAAYVSDEVDDIFYINRDYNYSLSGPDGSGMRSPDTIVTSVMDEVMGSILGSKTEPLTTLTAILQNNQQSILAKIEINEKGEEVSRLRPFLEAIAGSIYDQKAPFGLTEQQWNDFKSQATKEQFVNFIITGQKGFPIPWDPNNETLKRIAALKHILMITLPGALALKADVDYGLGPDGYSVVPKKEGESIPNVRYGDEYELITFQYLYHASKAPSPEYFAEQWRKEEDLMESGDRVAQAIWKTWKQEANVDEMPAAERQKALYAKYSSKESWKQRLTLLRKDILENKIKLYNEQIKCNAQDPLSKEVTNTGASGTVNEYSLPDSFNRDSTVMSRQVMADTMIKLAIMNKEGINQPVVVFTDINDVIKKGANNMNCKYIIDQGSATEGRTTREIVDYVRSVSPTRQILFVANVVEHGKQIRRQMMLNPGAAAPEPFDRAKLSKDCLVYFGPPDIRGTDWPIPPGEGILITGATTTEEQLLQAIWRARKLGSGQTVQLYLHESVAKSIKPDGKVTIGEALNDIKKRTLDAKAGINLKAALHKIKNIIPQEVKKELFKTSIRNEEEYWSLDVTKDQIGVVDAARALKILMDIDSDCERFDAARGLFIEKREINFESDYSPTELKEIERVIAERFEAERRKLHQLLPLGAELNKRMNAAINEAEAKFKAEFEERHKKNLKPKISTAAGGSNNSQEQVQEQQQQQQQQMVSLKMEASKPKPPMPDKKLNTWVNWTTHLIKDNIQQHFMNPAADANDRFNLGLSAAKLLDADCGFSPNLLITENYRRLWNEMKVHDNELMGRIAIIKTNHDLRFVLIDQLDFDQGFLPCIKNPGPDFKIKGNSLGVFALNGKSKEPLICNAMTGILELGSVQNQFFEQLVQTKVLAGCLAFNDADEKKALTRWIGHLNPDQKSNLLKLYCKMRKADNVGQIYGWLDSPLASLLK